MSEPNGRVAGAGSPNGSGARRMSGASGPAAARGDVLVAGMGNTLRGDDGFGPAVTEALAERGPPPGVRLIEVGIGGMHLVQELLDGYRALILIDAADRGAEPGTLFVLRPEVPDLRTLPPEESRELLADMHFTVPSRALLMARALDALPENVWMIGCQPEGEPALGIGLSPRVRAAVDRAVELVVRLASEVAAAETKGSAG